VQRRYIGAIAQRAKVDLEPAAVWLLVKIEENGAVRIADLSRRYNVDTVLLDRALADLVRRGFVVPRDGGPEGHRITTEGCAVFNRLVEARRAKLMEIISEWSPDERQKVAALLQELARHLVPEAREQREPSSGGRFDQERRALQWQFCYLRIRDAELLAETYEIQLDKYMMKIPLPTAAGVKSVLEELAERNPKAREQDPTKFFDDSFVREFQTNGFIESLYR
jgi:DNA-binding MarR family transcriptional regulator